MSDHYFDMSDGIVVNGWLISFCLLIIAFLIVFLNIRCDHKFGIGSFGNSHGDSHNKIFAFVCENTKRNKELVRIEK